MVTTKTTVVDSNSGLLVRTAEKRIPCEIKNHFNSMLIYRYLRDGITNSDTCVITTHKRRRDFDCKREVHVENCTSRVLSCLPCKVLIGYCVLWAESDVRVSISNPFLTTTGYDKRRGGKGTGNEEEEEEEEDGYNSNKINKRGRRGILIDERDCEYRNIQLFSLHIVDQRAYEHPMRYSFALQSLCQPGRPLQLQCYPYHMVHFGLLMHAIWNAPDVLFETEKRESSHKEKPFSSTEFITDLNNKHNNSNSNNNNNIDTSLGLPLLTKVSNAGVLLLGLGGNVIGNCLDVALSPDIPIDVVEIEPSVLEICKEHNQLPQCEVQQQSEDNKRKVWNVSQSHQRYPHYRFILADARALLQDTDQYYSIIFLDCYDPARERMMHDSNLIDLCHARLIPGGAVIVNAHIVPRRETLNEQFLSRGFASIQVLRVAGCDQCIVVCLAGNNGTQSDLQMVVKEEKEEEEERLNRFCVRFARLLARRLCDISITTTAKTKTIKCDNTHRSGFQLDAEWLKSSRCLEGLSHHTRVWEHYE